MYKDRQTLIGIDVAQRRSTPLLSVDSDEYSVSSCRFKNEDYVVCSARVTDFIDGRLFPVTREQRSEGRSRHTVTPGRNRITSLAGVSGPAIDIAGRTIILAASPIGSGS